jgi:hypothetical protein
VLEKSQSEIETIKRCLNVDLRDISLNKIRIKKGKVNYFKLEKHIALSSINIELPGKEEKISGLFHVLHTKTMAQIAKDDDDDPVEDEDLDDDP